MYRACLQHAVAELTPASALQGKSGANLPHYASVHTVDSECMAWVPLG